MILEIGDLFFIVENIITYKEKNLKNIKKAKIYFLINSKEKNLV